MFNILRKEGDAATFGNRLKRMWSNIDVCDSEFADFGGDTFAAGR